MIVLISLGPFILKAQPQQPKSFYVNACSFYGGFKSELEPICEGFQIRISQYAINLGEDIDLKIKSREIFDDKILFQLDDPKKEIMAAFYGKSPKGNDYLQLLFKSSNNEEESGLIFQYWDYVSNYDFWRANRKNPITFRK